jgi:fermentation-respiration switch protein FrsA (DUF1100 family)
MKSVLNHPIISQRYFYPRHEPFTDPCFFECNSVRLACYYKKFHPASKTIVFFHGNGEVVADYLDFFPKIVDDAGYNLLMFEYRGYGMSSGSPAMVAMLEDVECVIRQLDIQTEDLVFYGRSVGTIYAVHAASVYTNASSLILESGIADVRERVLLRINDPYDIGSTWEETDNEFSKYFNTKQKLKTFKGKSFVLHTLNDSLISVSHAKQLYSFLNEPKKIHIFKRGDHNTIFYANKDEYFRLIFDFLND